MGALYGHAVVSERPLERLRPGAAPRGVLRLRMVADLPDAAGVPILEGEQIRVGRDDAGRLVLDCLHVGRFALDTATCTIEARDDCALPGWFEHRLGCLAAPLMLAERGDLALHAATVATDRGAVLVAGESRAGKSTLAWALGEAGYGVLAEDGTVLELGGERPVAWPGLTGVRLRDERGQHGATLPVGGDDPSSLPVAAVVLLGVRGGTAPTAVAGDPVTAVADLLAHSLHAPGSMFARAFSGAAEIARSVPIVRGTMPDDLPNAPLHAEALVERVLDVAGASAPASR